MFVGRYDVSGIEEPVDEETSGAGFDVSAGQARDWCFGLRRRFLFIPRLPQLILCGAHVLFSPGENLGNKLRRHIEQSRHLNSVLGLVIFGFKKLQLTVIVSRVVLVPRRMLESHAWSRWSAKLMHRWICRLLCLSGPAALMGHSLTALHLSCLSKESNFCTTCLLARFRTNVQMCRPCQSL